MPEERKEFQEMFSELNMYENGSIYCNGGKPASPTQIVQAHMVSEDSGYMRDYVLNENGDLKALYFYHVNQSIKVKSADTPRGITENSPATPCGNPVAELLQKYS